MGTNIHLRFPAGISTDPVVCNLTRLYDLNFNITTAQISSKRDGFMAMELLGPDDNIREAIEYLKNRGIEVTPVAQRVTRDEKACVECGMCTAICPTSALKMDENRHLTFDPQKCTVCKRCVHTCPVHAMHADSEAMGGL